MTPTHDTALSYGVRILCKVETKPFQIYFV